ncbi:MAG: transposase [Prevotella sp.]|nr:transposase [Prevotella sp.]
MAIPKDILAVQRPSSTVVKQRGTRFVVVKRTSKRVGTRVVPVDIGTVGEIIDGRFVERKPEAPRKKTIDIKDYGEVALCNKHGKDLLDELARVWDLNDAKRLYTIALLRAAYGDIKNRDLLLQYATSFASEIIPGVHLSEDAVSAFLQEIGQAYSMICEFMRNRVEAFAGKNIVIDGMLKDYNSQDGYMSEFSRKARTKGSKDLSLLYAFNPETKEPIAAKPYPGNMLDQTSINNFVTENKIVDGMMIFDKGFYNEGLFEKIDKMEGLSYLIPLKQNSAFIRNYGMDSPTEHLKGYTDATILYKKVRMSNGKYLYAFRDPKMAYEQEVAYVQQAQKKEAFDSEKYIEKKSLFGLIVFKSKKNLDPLTVYLAYSQRWQIETLFNLYKNIIDRDTVNVHSDYRVYATELINFLSVIITTRVKNEIVKKELNKKYSYKQIFRMLSKYKKARIDKDAPWEDVTKLKYIEELTKTLDV